jgi:hypothetical protein
MELIWSHVAVRTVIVELLRHHNPLAILVALVEELDVVFLAVLVDLVLVSKLFKNQLRHFVSLLFTIPIV